jgi:hypothetical protein
MATETIQLYLKSEIDEQLGVIRANIQNKAESGHTHTIANISSLQEILDSLQSQINALNRT